MLLYVGWALMAISAGLVLPDNRTIFASVDMTNPVQIQPLNDSVLVGEYYSLNATQQPQNNATVNPIITLTGNGSTILTTQLTIINQTHIDGITRLDISMKCTRLYYGRGQKLVWTVYNQTTYRIQRIRVTLIDTPLRDIAPYCQK